MKTLLEQLEDLTDEQIIELHNQFCENIYDFDNIFYKFIYEMYKTKYNFTYNEQFAEWLYDNRDEVKSLMDDMLCCGK